MFLSGKHPQTGDPLPRFDCAHRWVPLLLVEAIKKTEGVIDTLDEARKEHIEQSDKFGRLAEELIDARVAGGDGARLIEGRAETLNGGDHDT